MVDSERRGLTRELARLRGDLEQAAMSSLVEPMLATDLTVQQLKTLVVLVTSADGGTGQSLGRTLGVSLATVSGIVDRLEERGMARRIEDEHDHRVRRVFATDEGRATIQRLIMTPAQYDRGVLGRLPIEDLRALAQGMRALVRAITDEDESPASR